MKNIVALVVVLGATLIAACWMAFQIWTGTGAEGVDFSISWHGWLAMGLGIVFTAALGAGLMALTFHSSRSGHDDIDQDP